MRPARRADHVGRDWSSLRCRDEAERALVVGRDGGCRVLEGDAESSAVGFAVLRPALLAGMARLAGEEQEDERKAAHLATRMARVVALVSVRRTRTIVNMTERRDALLAQKGRLRTLSTARKACSLYSGTSSRRPCPAVLKSRSAVCYRTKEREDEPDRRAASPRAGAVGLEWAPLSADSLAVVQAVKQVADCMDRSFADTAWAEDGAEGRRSWVREQGQAWVRLRKALR